MSEATSTSALPKRRDESVPSDGLVVVRIGEGSDTTGTGSSLHTAAVSNTTSSRGSHDKTLGGGRLKMGATVLRRYRIVSPAFTERQVETYKAVEDKRSRQVTVVVTPRCVETERESCAVLDVLNGGPLVVPGIPRLLGVVRKRNYTVRVVSTPGPRLDQLFRYCHDIFTSKTICMLAIQALHRLEALHSRGYAHGNICPENFAMGPGPFDAHHLLLTNYSCANKADPLTASFDSEKFGAMKQEELLEQRNEHRDLLHRVRTDEEINKSSGSESSMGRYNYNSEKGAQQEELRSRSPLRPITNNGGTSEEENVSTPSSKESNDSAAGRGKSYEQMHDCSESVNRLFSSVRLDKHYVAVKRELAAAPKHNQQQRANAHLPIPWIPATPYDDIESLVNMLWYFEAGSLPWDRDPTNQIPSPVAAATGSPSAAMPTTTTAKKSKTISQLRQMLELKEMRTSHIVVTSSVGITPIAKLHEANRTAAKLGTGDMSYRILRSFFEDYLRDELQQDPDTLDYQFDWTPQVVPEYTSSSGGLSGSNTRPGKFHSTSSQQPHSHEQRRAARAQMTEWTV